MEVEKGQEYGERLAKVETNTENILGLISKLEAKIDSWQTNYVPRTELNEAFKARDNAIKGVEDRVEKTEANQTWLWRTTIGGIITCAIGLLFALSKLV